MRILKQGRYITASLLLCCIVVFLLQAWAKEQEVAIEPQVGDITAVAATQMNVLYVGIENTVKIASSGIKSSELVVTVDNGTITGKNGLYIIVPNKVGSASISIQHNGKEIEKSHFRVKPGLTVIPVLQIDSFNYSKGGTISINMFKSAIGLDVIAEGSDFDVPFDIIRFTISTGDKQVESNSSTLTDEQKSLIANSKPNSEIFIENIYVRLDDETTRNLPRMAFALIE